MFKGTFFCLLLSLLIAHPVCAQEQKAPTEIQKKEAAFKSDNDFGLWVSYYYQNPEPQRILSAFRFYCRSRLYKQASGRMPMAAFFSSIFKNNTSLMKNVFNVVSMVGNPDERIFLLNVLWLTDTRESKNLISFAKKEWKRADTQDVIKRMIKAPLPGNLLFSTVTNPAQIDMLWNTFSATGNKEYILKIISILRFNQSDDAKERILSDAALWSLTSMAIYHKKVFDVCQEQIQKQSGIVQKLLKDVVEKAQQRRGLDEKTIKSESK